MPFIVNSLSRKLQHVVDHCRESTRWQLPLPRRSIADSQQHCALQRTSGVCPNAAAAAAVRLSALWVSSLSSINLHLHLHNLSICTCIYFSWLKEGSFAFLGTRHSQRLAIHRERKWSIPYNYSTRHIMHRSQCPVLCVCVCVHMFDVF